MPRQSGSFLAQLSFGVIGILILIMLVKSGAIFLAGEPIPGVALSQSTSSHSVSVPGSAPQITAVTLNNASSIILIANATKTVTVSFTVSDDNGCGSVFYGSGNVTTTLYRSGVSSTCATASVSQNEFNYLFCYYTATTTHNCPSANSTTTSANATATIDLWYFADATDASSSYPGETWLASVYASDASSLGSTTTASGVEMHTLLSIHVTTGTLNYGTVNPGQNTSGTNQIAPIKNAGNASATLNLNGIAMCSGGNCLATSSQHYASSSFTYGGTEQLLQDTAQTVSGWLVGSKPLGAWATTTPYPGTIYFHKSFANNGFVYVIGGIVNGSHTSTARYAPLNATGSIGQWATTTPYPATIADYGSFVYNGYVYVVGGIANGSSYTSTVRYAPVSATGSIGQWATTTPYPATITSRNAFVYNGFVYVVGGTASGTATSTVRYAPINATGSIGQWATTTPYPATIISNVSLAYNGYVYAVGGLANGSFTSSVYIAPILASGSIGTWTTTTPYPSEIYSHTAFISNGLIYVLGGNPDGVFDTSTVSYAPIRDNGDISAWATTTPYSTTITVNSSFIANSFFYIIGGFAGMGSYTSTIRYAPLPSKNTYWGLGVDVGTPSGTYSGLNTFTAVFAP